MRHLACCLVLGLLTTGCSPRAADEGPAAGAAATAILRGRVERVGDGDSLRARVDGEAVEVRLYGIDAPELDAPFGREAQQALERRVVAREISLVPVTRDSYQRLVAVVVVDGQSVNEAMIGAGHAWAYRQYLGEIAGAQRYCEAEADARASRRGLWSQAPERWVPPWVARARARGQRGAATAAGD
ncbi:MAG: thermonuclease family protein, partial [Gammaproteobacteria bacterium]|nr:thermonuclease family protein [Gammaproteobacteria bacterium]